MPPVLPSQSTGNNSPHSILFHPLSHTRTAACCGACFESQISASSVATDNRRQQVGIRYAQQATSMSHLHCARQIKGGDFPPPRMINDHPADRVPLENPDQSTLLSK